MKINIKTSNPSEKRTYSVEKRIEIYDPRRGDEPDITLYTEDVDITVEQKSSEIVAKVVRSNVRKANAEPNQNPLEHYFVKSGEALNKLDLQLTSDGKIEKVVNRDEVLQNWEYIKIYLDHYFVSDDENVISTIKGWTQQIDQVVKDEDLFLETVNNDLLYNRLFSGYWLNYDKNNQAIKNQPFPGIFGNVKTVLTEKLTASEKDGMTQIEISGRLNRELSDMAGIAASLGIEEDESEGLSIGLKATYLIDSAGLIEKIDLRAEATMAETDFKRNYGLTVRKRD